MLLNKNQIAIKYSIVYWQNMKILLFINKLKAGKLNLRVYEKCILLIYDTILLEIKHKKQKLPG